MTVQGATAPGPRGTALHASRRPFPASRGIVFGLAAALVATAAVGGGVLLRSLPGNGPAPHRAAETAPVPVRPVHARSPSRHAELSQGLRVVAPPVRTTARPRHAPAAPAPRRPDTASWHPHLLEAPRIAEASFFAAPAPVRIAAFEPPAEPVASFPATRIAAVRAPAGEAFGPVFPPANAEQALEAALVPTPSARPRYRTIMSAPPQAAGAKPATPLLAYARPDAGMADEDVAPARPGLFQSPRAGNGVAVYDIGAATVYMPNGERLEAHSGLGAMRDDARFVHVKMRGATPPHTYDLRLRESLFHGVAAIRLTPVGGERQIYNRVGLLAHTYMLGKRGDSNGCVSFKDYKRFLAAFRRGEVKRLVVVKHLDPVSRFASLFRAKG